MFKKTIFVVQAYLAKDDAGRLADVVTLQLYSNSEQEALARAAKLITRNHYRVSEVIEK